MLVGFTRISKDTLAQKKFKNHWARRNLTSEVRNLNITSVTAYNFNFMSNNNTGNNDHYFKLINEMGWACGAYG